MSNKTPLQVAKSAIRKRSEEDRRARQAVRLANVMRIQELLLGRGRWNVKTLAAELECSEKTVHRHLGVLELAGVPWYYDPHDRCYHVRPGFKFPVVNLSPDELLGQAAATAVAKAAGIDAGADARPATRKIAASSQETGDLLADAEAVMEVLNLKLADHSRHQEMIRSVQWALVRKKQVVGQYVSPYQEKPVKLALHPYRLCFAGQAWYLIARGVEEKQPKTYRITRFQSLRMIDAAAQRPDRFSLDDYFGNAWGVFRGRESYAVVIEFIQEAAALVTETRWHKTQEVQREPDGRAVLSFQVDGLDEIFWWVLGWSGRAKVIQPEKLREMVVEKLRQAPEMNTISPLPLGKGQGARALDLLR
jgi:predicted DNA-binding transcriptional regulator YafY